MYEGAEKCQRQKPPHEDNEFRHFRYELASENGIEWSHASFWNFRTWGSPTEIKSFQTKAWGGGPGLVVSSTCNDVAVQLDSKWNPEMRAKKRYSKAVKLKESSIKKFMARFWGNNCVFISHLSSPHVHYFITFSFGNLRRVLSLPWTELYLPKIHMLKP